MLNVIFLLCYSAFLALGVFFASRWLVAPPAALQRFPGSLRVAALLLGCWGGCFAASSLALNIGYWVSGGVAYDEGVEMPFEILYDGLGNNVLNLVFGWLSGFLAWGIARALPGRRAQ